MGMREVESKILAEVRTMTGRKSLRLKDLLQWSTSREAVVESAVPDQEDVLYVNGIGVWVAIPKAKAKRGPS